MPVIAVIGEAMDDFFDQIATCSELEDGARSRVGPWLVLRTWYRHEGVVESALQQKQVCVYLPRGRVVQWRKGQKKRVVMMPLFPGYVFVQPRANQYGGMRYIRGSCGFVLAGNTPAKMPEQDMVAIKALVDSRAALMVDSELVPGERVKIIAGPFMGVEGELVRVKSQDLLVINAHLVGCSVRVEVDREAVSAL